jgi:hypothetical protein
MRMVCALHERETTTPQKVIDGFIHTSNAHQLPGTLDRFFKDAQRVWILAIPRTENMEETHGLKVRCSVLYFRRGMRRYGPVR